MTYPGLPASDTLYPQESGISVPKGLGSANGIATLDVSGLIPVEQVNPSTGLSYMSVTGDTTLALSCPPVVYVLVSAPTTIILPGSVPTETVKQIVVKDHDGVASTNNITIDGNGANIDGTSTILLTRDYESVTLHWSGDRWSLL